MVLMDAFDLGQNGTPAYHWQTLVFGSRWAARGCPRNEGTRQRLASLDLKVDRDPVGSSTGGASRIRQVRRRVSLTAYSSGKS